MEADRAHDPAARLDEEIRRRTDAVGTLPDRQAIGTVPAGRTDERAEGRRCLGLEVLARCRLTAVEDTEARRAPTP